LFLASIMTYSSVLIKIGFLLYNSERGGSRNKKEELL